MRGEASNRKPQGRRSLTSLSSKTKPKREKKVLEEKRKKKKEHKQRVHRGSQGTAAGGGGQTGERTLVNSRRRRPRLAGSGRRRRPTIAWYGDPTPPNQDPCHHTLGLLVSRNGRIGTERDPSASRRVACPRRGWVGETRRG